MYPSYFEAITLFLISFVAYNLARRPLLAGVASGLLITIKVSTLVFGALVSALVLALVLLRRSPFSTHQILRFLGGFVCGLTPAFLVMGLDGLTNWIEVVSFNAFYSEFRSDGLEYREITAVAISLASLLCALGVYAYCRGRVETDAPATIASMFTLAAGSLVALSVLQMPMAYQHQHLVTGAVMIALVSSFALWKTQKQWIVSLASLGTILALLVPVGMTRTFSPTSTYLETASPQIPEDLDLSELSEKSQDYLVLLGPESRLPRGAIETLANLPSCRFTYFYSHVEAYFSEEMAECLSSTKCVLTDEQSSATLFRLSSIAGLAFTLSPIVEGYGLSVYALSFEGE